MRSLLANAVKRNDRNIYVIGADPDIFKKLWLAAGKNGEKRRAAAETPSWIVSCQEVLDLLHETEVPPELERRFVGTSRAAQLVRRLIMRAASTREDVLILGDTGTGKEVVARCIHDNSGRQPFVHVNCAAFAGDRLEVALFGDASDASAGRQGFWRSAGAGMIFLDEIGGLRLDHQAKIMRALEERRIRPVGARNDIAVPARVVAASNRDLFALMQAGQFREDLYYRLRSFTIRIATLRTHPEDIPPLAQSFWKSTTSDEDAELSAEVLSALGSYHWPGNARELKAALSAVHALFGKDDLRVEHFRAVFQELGQAPASGPLADGREGERKIASLRHLRHVDEVLRACQVTVRPVVEERRVNAATFAAVHVTLHHRLHELELLCMQPFLFNSEGTFSAVYGLKGKLAYFHGLLETDTKDALRYWKTQVVGEFNAALSGVLQEERRIVEGV